MGCAGAPHPLNPSASVAETAAREKDHEGHEQQQPEQWAHSDTARYRGDYQDDQKQLYESHNALLWVDTYAGAVISITQWQRGETRDCGERRGLFGFFGGRQAFVLEVAVHRDAEFGREPPGFQPAASRLA